jgi:hypothetical protein
MTIFVVIFVAVALTVLLFGAFSAGAMLEKHVWNQSADDWTVWLPRKEREKARKRIARGEE